MELFPSLNNFPTYRPRPENQPQSPQRAAVRALSVSPATHTTTSPTTVPPQQVSRYTARTDSFSISRPDTWFNPFRRFFAIS